jgi:hypothetical protein
VREVIEGGWAEGGDAVDWCHNLKKKMSKQIPSWPREREM